MSWSPTSRADAYAKVRDAGVADWVLRHAACVEGLAVAMAEAAVQQGHGVAVDRVRLGAILHDIGRSRTQDATHAHVGADILRHAACDADLVAIVERHTGAGLWPDDAKQIGLPPGDYVPSTLEEKIVAHADNLYSGDKRLDLESVRRKYEAKGLHVAWRRILALHEELTAVLGVDPQDLPSKAAPVPEAG